MTRTRAVRWPLVFVGAWAALFALRAAVGVTRGLSAEYFENADRTGAPVMSVVDPVISTSRMTGNWVGDPPGAFGVRWFGNLMVPRAGTYAFATVSDDGSWLTVDGQLVVDNGGDHGAITRAGRIALDRGPHQILVEYAQTAGDYEISLLWGAAGGEATRLTDLPSWRLSPARVPEWKILLARSLDLASIAALAGALLCGAWVAVTRKDLVWAPIRRYPRAASFALFALLTVAETWPLASHPARMSRNDNGDTVLNEWALAWVVHQAPRAPLHLFDGNIFHPERNTLAYSESMIVQAAMAAPLFWLGASPVLAYNLVLMAGFALTGWAMSLVIWRWTGSWAAAITSGILFAFNSHTFARMPHLQAQHVEFLPLALLALDTLLRAPQPRHAVRLAMWFVLQALTSVYLLVFTAISLTAAAVARPEDWAGRRFGRVAPAVLLSAALAAVVLLPFMLPYWRVSHEQELTRTLEDASGFAAGWRNYLSSVSQLHYNWWSYKVISSPALFPGAVGSILALVAIVRGVAFTDPRARMCLVFGVVGVVLSFGTNVPGYATLYRFVPMLQAIRAVSRFGYLGIVAVAVLAGFGVAELRKLTSARLWAPLAFLLPAVVLADGSPAPVWYARFEGVPKIYRQVREEPNAIVVELPLHPSGAAFQEARYMLNSTEHWKPMLNGYSGFQPESYHLHVEALANFPDARSIEALRKEGVTHVFVHVSDYGPAIVGVLDGTPGFHKLSTEGGIVLYRLD